MIVVDTNVLSEALRPAPEANVMSWLAEHSPTYRIPAIVLAELWAGVDALPSGARKKRLSEAIDQIAERANALDRVLPVTAQVARAFGTVMTKRRKMGHAPKPMDALLAATALAHGASIATRNTHDFTGLGLTLVNPWES